MSRRAGPQAGPPRLEHVLAVGMRALSTGGNGDDADSTPQPPPKRRASSPEQKEKARRTRTPLESEIARIPQIDARPHGVIAYYLVPPQWTHEPYSTDIVRIGLHRFFHEHLKNDIDTKARGLQVYDDQVRDAAIICKQLLFFSLHSSYRQDVINHRNQMFYLHTNQTLQDLAAGMVSGGGGNTSSESAGFWKLLRVLNYKMVTPGPEQEDIKFGTPLREIWQRPFTVARVTPYNTSLHAMPPEFGPAPAKDWLRFIYNSRSGVLDDERMSTKADSGTRGFNAGKFLHLLAGEVAEEWSPPVNPEVSAEEVGSFDNVALIQRTRLMSIDAS